MYVADLHPESIIGYFCLHLYVRGQLIYNTSHFNGLKFTPIVFYLHRQDRRNFVVYQINNSVNLLPITEALCPAWSYKQFLQ